jgi:hypothetical protein
VIKRCLLAVVAAVGLSSIGGRGGPPPDGDPPAIALLESSDLMIEAIVRGT